MFDDDISMISKKKPIKFRSDYEGDLKEIDLDWDHYIKIIHFESSVFNVFSTKLTKLFSCVI